ncbi:MAG: MoaD/ThiS family protein [Chloroflexota bacterium]
MSVSIEIPSYLQPYANGKEILEAEGGTVGECLEDIVRQFPGIEKMLFDSDGNIYGYVGIYVNGEDAYPEELLKPVKDGDKIQVLYIIGGG